MDVSIGIDAIFSNRKAVLYLLDLEEKGWEIDFPEFHKEDNGYVTIASNGNNTFSAVGFTPGDSMVMTCGLIAGHLLKQELLKP